MKTGRTQVRIPKSFGGRYDTLLGFHVIRDFLFGPFNGLKREDWNLLLLVIVFY